MAVIPARYGSRRIEGKPLVDIDGEPLVVATLRRVRAASSVDRVVVATDDERIALVVRQVGAEAFLTGAHPSGTHRVASLLDVLDEPLIVNVQCDQPGLEPVHVDRVVELLRAGAGVSTLAAPYPPAADPSDPALVKVVCDAQGRAIYFSRLPIPWGGPWKLHVGIYGFQRDFLSRCTTAPASDLELSEDLEQLRWLAAGIPIRVAVVDQVDEGLDSADQLRRLRNPTE